MMSLQLWLVSNLLREISILSNNSTNSSEETESYSIWKKTLRPDEPHLAESPVVIMCDSLLLAGGV